MTELVGRGRDGDELGLLAGVTGRLMGSLPGGTPGLSERFTFIGIASRR
jgi:hypothetical protein